MRRTLPVTVICLVLLCTLSGTAQEQAGDSLEPVEEFICWDEDIARLDAIKDSASLTILQLLDLPDEKVKIDDKFLEKLERFQGIKTLLFGCPHITNHGLKHIAKLKHLECLIIYQCEITDAGVQELKGLSKLQTVGFHKTAVTEEGIAELKVTLKKTYFELGSFGKNGNIFDANGCLRPRFVKPHLTLPKGGLR